MTEITLPHAACLGVDAPDGTVYHVKKNRPGIIEVDNPAHARLFKQALGAESSRYLSFGGGLPSKVCRKCGFNRFVFKDRPDACPRCKEKPPSRRD